MGSPLVQYLRLVQARKEMCCDLWACLHTHSPQPLFKMCRRWNPQQHSGHRLNVLRDTRVHRDDESLKHDIYGNQVVRGLRCAAVCMRSRSRLISLSCMVGVSSTLLLLPFSPGWELTTLRGRQSSSPQIRENKP